MVVTTMRKNQTRIHTDFGQLLTMEVILVT